MAIVTSGFVVCVNNCWNFPLDQTSTSVVLVVLYEIDCTADINILRFMLSVCLSVTEGHRK